MKLRVFLATLLYACSIAPAAINSQTFQKTLIFWQKNKRSIGGAAGIMAIAGALVLFIKQSNDNNSIFSTTHSSPSSTGTNNLSTNEDSDSDEETPLKDFRFSKPQSLKR
jgi:hypothetical protein